MRADSLYGDSMYVPADAPLSEHHSLVEVCQRVRGSIICLLSALRFHELTMQNPFEVWITIDRRTRRPKVDYPPLRVVLSSGAALTAGIQEHVIEGLPVRVYSPAKTVADCFKYRNQVGLDVALEALHACWRQRRATMAELWELARVCHVNSVMRPYLEAVLCVEEAGRSIFSCQSLMIPGTLKT